MHATATSLTTERLAPQTTFCAELVHPLTIVAFPHATACAK